MKTYNDSELGTLFVCRCGRILYQRDQAHDCPTPYRRSRALHIAAYEQASRVAAAWARAKMREFQIRIAADERKPAPLWMYAVLGGLLALGAGVVTAVFCKLV